ncbi:hypothetical protein [Vibrio parahaemolyticus]|uniref:hypothetical protein n=1 Tax=Vibrio parahaemolyticus TaxID=670 RepID=UPI000471D4B5|nr:hypothetical protein [Vibrio parahaemolyticus]ELB2137276.1 hypothetical protein [Vibrio parahaemolyticus]MCQ9048902.1 hypothetical protein [Vibrio parahaemolyticus]HCG5490249.1 hypothetical protein [Vibrio parahaemolyticus]
MKERHDYLIECFKTAREELLMRVKRRDEWLKLQLFAQFLLWALAHGITFAKVSGICGAPIYDVLILSFPISLVMMGLYSVEDGLISRLSKYIGSLSGIEKTLCQSSEFEIKCWDNSSYLASHADGTSLKIRVFVQFIAFVVIPLYLTVLSYNRESFPAWLSFLQIALLVCIVGIMVFGYKSKSDLGVSN